MLFELTDKYWLEDKFDDLCTDDEIRYAIENRINCRIVATDVDNGDFYNSYFDIVFDNGLKLYGISGECLILVWRVAD